MRKLEAGNALLAEDVEGLEPLWVAIFCPECARVEFGYRVADEAD